MTTRRVAFAFLVLGLATLGPSQAEARVTGYGKRSQVGQLVRQLDQRGKAPRTGFIARAPLLQKLAAFLRPGLSVKNDVRQIETFLRDTEAKLGEPISTLSHPALKDDRRMRAEKAMALLAFGRKPSEVTEEFVRTSAKVKGAEDLAVRDIFVQRWRPIGKPSGKVYVMAPGFLQTGRNFYEQVQLLNAEGHEVLLMDQQWAGYTADAVHGVKKGAIDRGLGIARDVVDIAAHGNALLEREYGTHPNKQLVIVGTSMGGGAGVLGALKHYDEGRIDLGPGRSIPADRGYITQGAYMGRTRSFLNNMLHLVGAIPLVRNLPLPAMSIPKLTSDKAAQAKFAVHAASEDIRGRPQAFRASDPDLAELDGRFTATGAPKGKGLAIHAENDSLANHALMEKLVEKAGPTMKLKTIPGNNHTMEEVAGDQQHVVEAGRAVDNRR